MYSQYCCFQCVSSLPPTKSEVNLPPFLIQNSSFGGYKVSQLGALLDKEFDFLYDRPRLVVESLIIKVDGYIHFSPPRE